MENDWYPGKEPTREEILMAEIVRLRNENTELKRELLNYSWERNPDTAGGAFRQDEIERARNDYWSLKWHLLLDYLLL